MKKILTIIAATTLLLTGCIKETFPQGSTQVASQVVDSEFALSGLINSIAGQMSEFAASGLYSSYEDQFDFGLPSVHLMTEFMLEDCVCLGEWGYCQYYYHVNNMGQSSKHWLSMYYWKYYYAWIKACNDAIKLIGKPTAATKTSLGQAYAWRAYCYLDMARLYEAKVNAYTDVTNPDVRYLTVPVVDENITEQKAMNNPRVTRDSLYNFILSDLSKAEGLLADAAGIDFKAPSLAVVYGLMARAYIEEGYWYEEGETWKGTDGENHKGEDYADAFENAAKYARLAIEASGCTPLTQEEWENPTTGFNKGSACNAWLLGLTLDSQNTNNLCNFTAMFASEALFGYGPLINPGLMPSTYNKIPDGDWRKFSWLDPACFNEKNLFDPAKAAAVHNYKFAGSSAEQELFLYGDGVDVMPVMPYQSLKFRPAEGACIDDTRGVAADHCLMRVEEMYFLEAEALAHDNLAEGKTALETFLNNYRYDANIATYTCDAADIASFNKELLFQKRLEFWGEGVLMFDYKRMNIGINRDDDIWPSGVGHVTTSRSPQWNICITRPEVQANAGIPEDLCNPDPSQSF